MALNHLVTFNIYFPFYNQRAKHLTSYRVPQASFDVFSAQICMLTKKIENIALSKDRQSILAEFIVKSIISNLS